jgi:hypothetical protein
LYFEGGLTNANRNNFPSKRTSFKSWLKPISNFSLIKGHSIPYFRDAGHLNNHDHYHRQANGHGMGEKKWPFRRFLAFLFGIKNFIALLFSFNGSLNSINFLVRHGISGHAQTGISSLDE